MKSIFEIKTDEGVSFKSDVEYDLKIHKTSKDLIVTGNARTKVKFECSRCLNDFEKGLIVDNLLYTFPMDELEDKLDISPFVREEFLLLLPIMPVCSDECKGLCPVCGKNLNIDRCDCDKAKKSSPFDVLDDLNIS